MRTLTRDRMEKRLPEIDAEIDQLPELRDDEARHERLDVLEAELRGMLVSLAVEDAWKHVRAAEKDSDG